jgi:hypothetical protein
MVTPMSDLARVIILTADAADDAQWRHAAYEQFCRDDDAPEDKVYDTQT